MFFFFFSVSEVLHAVRLLLFQLHDGLLLVVKFLWYQLMELNLTAWLARYYCEYTPSFIILSEVTMLWSCH